MLNNYRLGHTECDFKREVEHLKTKSWLKSVCAFANGIGGMLVFGIDDETRTHKPIADMQKEIEFITNGVVDAIQAIYQYEHSVYGILNNIKEDYNNLDLDASKIQKELADPENMGLLKAVLAKLG